VIAFDVKQDSFSHDRPCRGTKGGAISVIAIEKMEVEQEFKSAHSESVTFLEFSPNDKCVLYFMNVYPRNP
jgi:hypothetical protein